MKSKSRKVMTITPQMIFDAAKPQFNGYVCGYGYYGKKKYDRNAAKRNCRRLLEEY